MGKIWTVAEIDDVLRDYFNSYDKRYLFVRIWKTATVSITKQVGHIQHLPIYYMENFVDLDNYFKFTVVRNPFDRLVSWFFYKKEVGHYGEMSFKRWVMNGCEHPENWQPKIRNLRPKPLHQYQWICDKKNKVRIDQILKFERLEQDWKTLCDRIRIPHRPLQHSNRSHFRKHKRYQRYYDREMVDFLSHRLRRELKYFGYTYEE